MVSQSPLWHSCVHAANIAVDGKQMTAVRVSAPLAGTAGITAGMMEWWLNNIEGDAPYVGDGQIWSKYLQW